MVGGRFDKIGTHDVCKEAKGHLTNYTVSCGEWTRKNMVEEVTVTS